LHSQIEDGILLKESQYVIKIMTCFHVHCIVAGASSTLPQTSSDVSPANSSNSGNDGRKRFSLLYVDFYTEIYFKASTKNSLQSLPDPYGRYANLVARHSHLKTATVNSPNIRDRNGVIIHPSDYSMKLGYQTPVFVTVKLRL
jgi:hypothetical protein